MQSPKPSRSGAPKANNHAKNPDQDELVKLLADVPADRLPALLSKIKRISAEAKVK